MADSMRPGYQAAQQKEWQPIATYTLLGVIVAFFIVQWIVGSFGGRSLHNTIFTINSEWPFRPWTLITATLSHSPTNITHLLFNGIVLFFFGPPLERILGWKRFVILFFVSGAIASVLQVYLSLHFFNSDLPGLGASGALMMIFGALMVIMPNEKVYLFLVLPVPFWAAGIGFAVLDILGAFNPESGTGNFAHLSGMAIGLWVGWQTREAMKKQGLRIVSR